jgi:hypothetical protein
MINRDAAHTAETESRKQAATYVDCVGAARWVEPALAITPEAARAMVERADRRVRANNPWSAERLRIWHDHMSPVHRTGDTARAPQAVLSAYEAMHAAGLITQDEVDDMRKFQGL